MVYNIAKFQLYFLQTAVLLASTLTFAAIMLNLLGNMLQVVLPKSQCQLPHPALPLAACQLVLLQAAVAQKLWQCPDRQAARAYSWVTPRLTVGGSTA